MQSETSDRVVSAWRTITASHAAAFAALEHELGKRLSESPNHKFRAQELAEAVHLSQSALSRLIDRLARSGLVERCLCDNDRRGIFVTLTEAGQQRHAEAAPTHREVLAGVLPAELLAPLCAAVTR